MGGGTGGGVVEVTYFMRGVYVDGIEEHPQVGILKIGLDDKIVGWIMDPDSPYLKENVKGELKIENGRIRMTLSKPQPGISVRYFFDKKGNHRSRVPGAYRGFWTRVDDDGAYAGRREARSEEHTS